MLTTRIVRDAVEENTGEKFTFFERLNAYADFVSDLQPSTGITWEHQRANLEFLSQLNGKHQEKNAWHEDLLARIESYELAFRMQTQVPELVDTNQEDAVTQSMYGLGSGPADAFGRKCLLARKLIERGVRFVQLYAGSWDSHDYIERAHGNLVQQVDQPIAALITDLKQRGLLESTLVVWCGEFGRSPDNGVRGGTAYGRDHNAKAISIWFAGGGVNAGHSIGATDETGAEAVEGVAPVRDLHVTILKLLGLEDHKLNLLPCRPVQATQSIRRSSYQRDYRVVGEYCCLAGIGQYSVGGNRLDSNAFDRQSSMV